MKIKNKYRINVQSNKYVDIATWLNFIEKKGEMQIF